jgi:predicted MFS family arabinose efflux permease
MIPFGPGSSLLLYAVAFFNLQFWWNWAAGPYAGLIPDVVAKPARATASAWMNVMSVLGSIVGNLLVALFYVPGHPATVVAMLIVINLAALWATLRAVREPAATGAAPRFALGPFLRSFCLDPRANANFYWVLITRLAGNMGGWSIFTFLLYYLRDVVGVARAENVLPALMGAGAVVAVPASMIGARLADRFGVVRVVGATSWLMAAAAIAYVLIAFAPSFLLVAPVVIVFAASYAAYQAVDWALALAVLPRGEDAGKDMGIWHIALVLPQIIGPAMTGWIISGVKRAHSDSFAYTLAFGLAALWFVVSAALVARVRLVRSE